jgi:hypothetical protein
MDYNLSSVVSCGCLWITICPVWSVVDVYGLQSVQCGQLWMSMDYNLSSVVSYISPHLATLDGSLSLYIHNSDVV